MDSRDRDILERAVRSIAGQAAKTNDLIDEAMDTGLTGDHPVTVAAKMVRRGLPGLLLRACTCLRHPRFIRGRSSA